LIFTGDPGIEVARSHYTDQKDRIADAGRDPAGIFNLVTGREGDLALLSTPAYRERQRSGVVQWPKKLLACLPDCTTS